MYVIRTVGWTIAAILGGRVTALEAQHPFTPYHLKVAAADATIVPLDGKAGQGLLPPHLEDGAILSLGPTFMNVIYENSTDIELGSCWGCVVTIGKELPCIYEAIKTGSVKALLNCGVGKTDLCHCADCLPDAVKKFVDSFCAAKGKPKTPSLKTPPAPAERIADADINFQAFKGSLLKSTADDLEAVNFCPGSSCGGCGCCIGACLFGACAGACVG